MADRPVATEKATLMRVPAHLTAQVQALIAERAVAVPREPDREMINAGTIAALEHRLEGKHRSPYGNSTGGEVYASWRAMVGAAHAE